MKSKIFVIVQFTLILAIALYAGAFGDLFENMLCLAGVLLGLWAIATMKLRVNVFPDVRENQTLYISGPYTYIRHPMYTAVLLVTLAWALDRFDVISVGLWLILLVDLLMKLNYEESLLKKKFTTYETYMHRTKRLIPYVY